MFQISGAATSTQFSFSRHQLRRLRLSDRCSGRETIAGLKANKSIKKVTFACFGENVYTAFVRQLKQVTD